MSTAVQVSTRQEPTLEERVLAWLAEDDETKQRADTAAKINETAKVVILADGVKYVREEVRVEMTDELIYVRWHLT